MLYFDLAAATGEQRHRILNRLHNTAPAVLTEDLVANDREGRMSDEFSVGHAIVEGPHPVGGDSSLYPLWYVELDCPSDVYTVVAIDRDVREKPNGGGLQILVVPDEGLPLVAYSAAPFVANRTADVHLQMPHEKVSTSVAVEAGELVDPPQGASTVAASRVVGLRAFDNCARPLGQHAKVQLGEVLGAACGGEEELPGTWRRVLFGVVHSEFVHEAVECGAEVVEPFAEDDGQRRWERCGCFHHDDALVLAMVNRASNRIGFQIFGGDGPQLLTMRSCSLYTGEQDVEAFIGDRTHESIVPSKTKANDETKGRRPSWADMRVTQTK